MIECRHGDDCCPICDGPRNSDFIRGGDDSFFIAAEACREYIRGLDGELIETTSYDTHAGNTLTRASPTEFTDVWEGRFPEELKPMPSRDRLLQAAMACETVDGVRMYGWTWLSDNNRTELHGRNETYDVFIAFVGEQLVECAYTPRAKDDDMIAEVEKQSLAEIERFEKFRRNATYGKFGGPQSDNPRWNEPQKREGFTDRGATHIITIGGPNAIPVTALPSDDQLYGAPTRDNKGNPVKPAPRQPGRITYAVDDRETIKARMRALGLAGDEPLRDVAPSGVEEAVHKWDSDAFYRSHGIYPFNLSNCIAARDGSWASLTHAFNWALSREGEEFWQNIYRSGTISAYSKAKLQFYIDEYNCRQAT